MFLRFYWVFFGAAIGKLFCMSCIPSSCGQKVGDEVGGLGWVGLRAGGGGVQNEALSNPLLKLVEREWKKLQAPHSMFFS